MAVSQHAAAIRNRIGAVIQDRGDHWCLRIVYRDEKDVRKDRYVSPTSWIGRDRVAFNALCLTDMGTRKLFVARVESAVMVPASDILPPMPQTVLESVGLIETGGT